MKHFYAFFSLVMLSLMGSVGAQAQYEPADMPEETITPGLKVVLQSGRDLTNPSYLSTSEADGYYSSATNASTIMTFEEAGEVDGQMSYYIKSDADGTYVVDLDYVDTGSWVYSIHFTAKQEEALRVIPTKTATHYDEYTAWVFKRTAESASFDTWFAPLNYVDKKPGFNNVIAGYEYNWCWIVFAANELGGSSKVENYINIYTPNGVEGCWKVGTNPGCISQTTYDALLTAYNKAADIRDNGGSETEANAAADALLTAYNNALADVRPVTPGYYFIRNFATEGLVYAMTRSDAAKELHNEDISIPETPNAEIGPYIWKLELENDAYVIYNIGAQQSLSQGRSINAPLPLTAQADYQGKFFIPYQSLPYSLTGGQFNVLNSFGNRCLVSLGDAVSYAETDEPRGDNALYEFIPVSEEYVNAYVMLQEQDSLNDKLRRALTDAQLLLEKTRVYDSETTVNGLLDTPGIISGISTNAQEPSEGDVANAVDSDLYSFFHSIWSDSEAAPEEYHYIQVELYEAVNSLALKLVRRYFEDLDASANLNPYTFDLLATNDPAGEWVNAGSFIANYNKTVTLFDGDEGIANMASITYIDLPAAYKYLRLVVTGTADGKTIAGYPLFNLSEIGVYKAAYNAEKSAYEDIDEAIISEIEAQIAQARTELSTQAGTQETLDKLTAAYNALKSSFLDPDNLRAMLQEARTFADYAAESYEGEIGFYAPGSLDAYADALTLAEDDINDVMTQAQYRATEEKIRKARENLDAALILPAEDCIYFVKSAETSSYNLDHYLCANSNDESRVTLSHSTDGSSEANVELRLNYMWRFKKNADGTFTALNVGTGTYLGSEGELGDDIKMSVGEKAFSLRTARQAGLLNFVMNNDYVAYTQPAMQNFILQKTAQGEDGGAYVFEKAEFQGTFLRAIKTGVQIMTLPFDIYGASSELPLLKIAGRNGNQLVCKPYESDDVIAAATPFIIDNTSTELAETSFFLKEDLDAFAIAYNLTPLTAQGLVGTLQSTTALRPACQLSSGKVNLVPESGAAIDANSGYILLADIPETTETSSYVYEIAADAVSGIATVTARTNNTGGIYNLAGQKLGNTGTANRLQPGIYIIDGRKQIVR